MATYALFFDGAVKSGKASFGFILRKNRRQIDFGYGLIGNCDSNAAELAALNTGLDSFIRNWDSPKSTLNVYGDSKVALGKAEKDPIVGFKLKEIRSWNVRVTLNWIPRAENKQANLLAKKLRNSGG